MTTATTIATWGINKLLAPKPKPVDKNKLQGEIQVSAIGEDIFINEIYGQRGADGLGGILTGITFIHVSDIRKIVTETTTSSGNQTSGGKGGGGAQQTRTNEYHYYTDLACLVAKGRARVLEIRAGTDVIYKNFPTPQAFQGAHYEAENAVMVGTSPNPDTGFSGGYNVPVQPNCTLTFNVQGDGKLRAVYIHYYCTGDGFYIDCTINGTARTVACPNTYGRIESVMVLGQLANGSTTVFLHGQASHPVVGGFFLDKISIGEEYAAVPEVQRFAGISNVRDYDYVNPYNTYDHFLPMNPLLDDYRAADEYNYQPVATNLGEQAVTLPAGCQLRIYEGTADQLPDPLLQQYYEPVYGAGSTPAIRDRCYFVLENFEITKYGSVPNFTVIVESIENATVGAMYESRAKRAGLLASEMDFETLKSVPLRGYAITQRQAPRTEMEIINRVHDLDVIENFEGKIQGVIPSDTVLVQIPAEVLDVREIGDGDAQDAQIKGIETLVRNEFELPKRVDLSYFDPSKSFEVGNSHATREVTVSEKRENIETALVLTESEAQKIVDRMMQQDWAEKDGESFTTFYKYGWLNPTDLVEVVDTDGQLHRVRLKERNGNIPGKLTFRGVSRNLYEAAPRIFTEPLDSALLPPWANVPPHMVGTILDVVSLRSTDNVPGVYIGAAMTDQAYQFKGAGLYWEREAGYELLSTIQKQATFGRTVLGVNGVLAAPPSGWVAGAWDTTSTVTVDLFYGELESRTDVEIFDGANVIVIGNEVLQFGVATRINGFPNRWKLQTLQRRIKGTIGSGHVSTERVMLLNDAVKFVPLDTKEYQVQRSYKFVSSGQDINSASAFNFTWNGNSNVYGPPLAASLVLIPQNFELADKTLLRTIYGEVAFAYAPFPQHGKVYWQRPGAGYELYTEISQDSDSGVNFRVADLQTGEHRFKVVAYNSNSGNKQTAAPVEYVVVISPNSYTINGKVVEPAIDRSMTGFDSNAQYIGRDTSIVPRNRISARVIKGVVVDNGLRVDVNVAGEVINAKIEQAAQGDSIFRSYVKVYNKFGELVTTFIPDGFTGAGTLGKGTYRRDHADPYEEAYFEIIVRNYYGNSLPRYLYAVNVMVDTPPPLRIKARCPTGFTGEPLSSSAIIFNASFNFSLGYSLALHKREVGGRYADWVYVDTLTALPYVAINLPSDKQMEYRLAYFDGIMEYASEIRQVKTFQIGQNSPARPAPSGLNVTPDNLDPYTRLDANWTRNATDNTSVDVEADGVVFGPYAANLEHFDFNSLNNGQTVGVRVRNVWNTGTPYSAWTDYKYSTTLVPPPPATPPQGFNGYYDQNSQHANLGWQLGTGGGNHVLEITDGSAWVYATTYDPNATGGAYSLPMTTAYPYTRYFRLKNNAGYASSQVEIYVPQAQEPPPSAEPPVLYDVYTIQETTLYYQMGGNFALFAPNNDDVYVMYDIIGGASEQYGAFISPQAGSFQFDVTRDLTYYDIWVYIRQDSTGDSNRLRVRIPGNQFQ